MENQQEKLRLDAFLPYRLAVLSNAVSGRIRRIYSEEFNLSIWEWRIIAILGEAQGLTSTEVSERALMDKPQVSRTVAGLLQRGLVSRRTDKQDRRRAPLTLTPDGEAIYKAVVPRARAITQDFLGALSDEDVRQLQAILDKLAAVASPARPLWSPTDLDHSNG